MEHFSFDSNYDCDVSVFFRAGGDAVWAGADAGKGFLAELGHCMLLGLVVGMDISLTCSNQAMHFSGTVVTEEFQDLMAALAEADAFQLEASYCLNPTEMASEGYPRECEALVACLRELEKQGETNAFFSTTVTNGAPEDTGLLFALGENQGRTFHGLTVPQPIGTFPREGSWHSPKEAIICHPTDLTGLDRAAISQVIQELSTLSEHDNLTDTPRELCYYMNNLALQTREDFEKFVRLTGQLIRLTKGECFTYAELVDWNAPHSRLLKIDFSQDGNYTMTLASSIDMI